MSTDAFNQTDHSTSGLQQHAPSMGWLLPLLLLVLTSGLIMYFLHGCTGSVAAYVPGAKDAGVVKTATVQPSVSLATTSIALADGKEITGFDEGMEEQLVAYINSTDIADSISKSRWFDFDNINFTLGSAQLTDSSRKQIQNIAYILAAYPQVKIKIGGYTDKTGDEPGNMQLSQSRADAVANAIRMAIKNPAQVTGAEGYGSQYATVPVTATDEERKTDRRISVNVREK